MDGTVRLPFDAVRRLRLVVDVIEDHRGFGSNLADARTSMYTNSFSGELHLLHSRMPFLSESGYVGLGPSNAECGDLVCIFSGGRVPHVIRPLPDGSGAAFSLVGDAYVYGLINGEFKGNLEAAVRD